MPLFENLFPYTNLHNLNLDWIIEMIEGIDPETVRALQELTPEFIAQINNKVNEAQGCYPSSQSLTACITMSVVMRLALLLSPISML